MLDNGRRSASVALALAALAVAGLTLMAGCETGPTPTPRLTQTAQVVQVVATFSPAPPDTPTPTQSGLGLAVTATPLPPTATPLPTATPVPTPSPTGQAATSTPRPTRKPAPPPTATKSPYMYLPDGDTWHEANPSFTEIKGVVRAADGTPLDGVIVMLDTGGLKIPLPTGQRPGYYSWTWCDWARNGTFNLYVLGPDGQPASPVIKVQTFSKNLMAIAIQDWRRTW